MKKRKAPARRPRPAPAAAPAYGHGVLLLSIGDELLDGRTQNTNASWMGEQLRFAGVPVAEVRCVSDRIEDIVRALHEGRNFPLVVSTGGLGPTNDDRTLAGASAAFKVPLTRTKASLEHVQSRYAARSLPLTEVRLRLADIPKGSKVVPNPTGTAPGVELKAGTTTYYFLPGPPSECRPMFTASILPIAQKKVAVKKLVRREFWRTFGKGEGEVYGRIAAAVEALELKYPRTFSFGVHITAPCIDLTLEVWNVKGERRPAEEEIEELISHVNQEMGSLVFTRERETLVQAVSRELAARKLTLATAESCTGGLLGKALTDIPGSSAYYWGGVISYDNRAKEVFLGVKPETLKRVGAVSEDTVREMAEGVRARLKTDYALSLSGVSGPHGGSAEKPVGTIHVALAGPGGTRTLHQVILGGKGSREQNRNVAVHLALDLLRDALFSRS